MTEGNDVWAQFTGTNNEFGRVFNMDLLDGCKPAWSLREVEHSFYYLMP